MTTAKPREHAVPGPCSVLLVEDDLALSGYLASSLIDAGYAVQSVSHRAEAGLRLALAPQPQLMLLDLGLPPHASGM